MALINNIWVFVESENLTDDVESTSHPVEKGVNLTDHVQRQPKELSISGKIVKHGKVKTSETVKKIKELQRSGSLIKYVGRVTESNMQIQSFSTSFTHANWGGCDFEMTLKEVRIAKTAYVAPKKTSKAKKKGTQKVKTGTNKKVYHKVKRGDTIWTLVTTKYKSLYPKYSNVMDKCNWVMKQNPKAFSRKGDFRTLQVGKKLYIGYRK